MHACSPHAKLECTASIGTFFAQLSENDAERSAEHDQSQNVGPVLKHEHTLPHGGHIAEHFVAARVCRRNRKCRVCGDDDMQQPN